MAYRTEKQRAPKTKVIASRYFDVRTFNIALLGLIAALLVGYLAISTQSATKGFTIKTLEHEIATLEDDQKRLDVEAVAHQSMENIEDRVGELGFVPVPAVEYLNAGASAVAIK